MIDLDRMAYAFLIMCAHRAVQDEYRSLALYDDIERQLVTRRQTATIALNREPQKRAVHAAHVAAAEIARSMVMRKRRTYTRRMADKLLAAAARVPERGTG